MSVIGSLTSMLRILLEYEGSLEQNLIQSVCPSNFSHFSFNTFLRLLYSCDSESMEKNCVLQSGS